MDEPKKAQEKAERAPIPGYWSDHWSDEKKVQALLYQTQASKKLPQEHMPDEKKVTELVCQIQKNDDPNKNAELKKELRDFLFQKLGKFMPRSNEAPIACLYSSAEDFMSRHFDFPASDKDRGLSYLYQFKYDERINPGFCAFLEKKLESEVNVYEPHATQLVADIQAGINKEENKKKLWALLFPCAVKLAFNCMRSNKGYQTADIEDAIQARLIKQFCADEGGYEGRNGQSYLSCIDNYKNNYSSDDKNCFTGYFISIMGPQFRTWYRDMDGVKGEKRAEENPVTGKEEKKTRYIKIEYSIDDSSDKSRGNSERSTIAAEAERKENERIRLMQETASRRESMAGTFKAVAKLFKVFFDDVVNVLDEDKEQGEKTVNERKILAYHMKYAYGKLASANIIVKELPDEYEKDNHDEGTQETRYDEFLAGRPKSFRDLLLSGVWQQTLDNAVSYQNEDYRRLFQSEDTDFLERLADRIKKKGIGNEQFIESEEAVINKLPYGWANTVTKRVKKDYKRIVIEGCKKVRREIGNGI
jgi:hypothetical protein